jgi:hypothetical protein
MWIASAEAVGCDASPGGSRSPVPRFSRIPRFPSSRPLRPLREAIPNAGTPEARFLTRLEMQLTSVKQAFQAAFNYFKRFKPRGHARFFLDVSKSLSKITPVN